MNDFFTLTFLLEMILKIVALSPKGYIRDSFNIVDGIIVVISLLDYSKLLIISYG